MIHKYFTYIALGLLSIIMIQGFFNGNTSNSELYQERINNYKKEKIQDLQAIDSLQNKFNTLKNEVHEIDSITSDYSNTQIDSFYTEFFR
tara:strand:- start:4781 stop:5050 length:270 start_codon:yes stop_codon:yes gene_type:complete